MRIGTTPLSKVTKKTAYLASGLLAGVLTLGFSGSVGAAPYGGYDTSVGASSAEAYSASYESGTTVASSESYKRSASCDYSAQLHYDAYTGTWKRMGYNYHTGVWFSCDESEEYKNSYFFNTYEKAAVDYSSYDNFHAQHSRY